MDFAERKVTFAMLTVRATVRLPLSRGALPTMFSGGSLVTMRGGPAIEFVIHGVPVTSLPRH